MTKDFTKTFASGKPAVRQTKGPGMNRGLKKKPKPKKPEPFRDFSTAKGKPGTKSKSKKKPGGFLNKGLF